jgi:hypothetical protein
MRVLKGFLLALALFGATACTVPQEKAEQVLQGAGYTEIVLEGPVVLRCSDDDQRSRFFRAKGPTGQKVEGAVCCGLLAKNCTIRLK